MRHWWLGSVVIPAVVLVLFSRVGGQEATPDATPDASPLASPVATPDVVALATRVAMLEAQVVALETQVAEQGEAIPELTVQLTGVQQTAEELRTVLDAFVGLTQEIVTLPGRLAAVESVVGPPKSSSAASTPTSTGS